MANKQKGEVSIEVDGVVYTLALTIDAMVALEEMFNTPRREVTMNECRMAIEMVQAQKLSNKQTAMASDALAAIEPLFHRSVTFQDVIAEADKGSIKHLRAMLWASLQLHHPTLTIKDISPLVQAAGGLGVFGVKFMELAKGSFADPADLEALGVNPNANPPRAQVAKKTNGTGAGSTSTRGASV